MLTNVVQKRVQAWVHENGRNESVPFPPLKVNVDMSDATCRLDRHTFCLISFPENWGLESRAGNSSEVDGEEEMTVAIESVGDLFMDFFVGEEEGD